MPRPQPAPLQTRRSRCRAKNPPPTHRPVQHMVRIPAHIHAIWSAHGKKLSIRRAEPQKWYPTPISSSAAACLMLIVNPSRPGRHQPRAIKRPKDRYTYLTRPRQTYCWRIQFRSATPGERRRHRGSVGRLRLFNDLDPAGARDASPQLTMDERYFITPHAHGRLLPSRDRPPPGPPPRPPSAGRLARNRDRWAVYHYHERPTPGRRAAQPRATSRYKLD